MQANIDSSTIASLGLTLLVAIRLFDHSGHWIYFIQEYYLCQTYVLSVQTKEKTNFAALMCSVRS